MAEVFYNDQIGSVASRSPPTDSVSRPAMSRDQVVHGRSDSGPGSSDVFCGARSQPEFVVEPHLPRPRDGETAWILKEDIRVGPMKFSSLCVYEIADMNVAVSAVWMRGQLKFCVFRVHETVDEDVVCVVRAVVRQFACELWERP